MGLCSPKDAVMVAIANLSRSIPWLSLVCALGLIPQVPAAAVPPRPADQTVSCDLLVIGGGLSGVATAYEALKAGRHVCMTEITDWVGGQVSAQGTSALDEESLQRSQRLYPRGYLEFRDRIIQHYDQPTPGNCWVSEVCFLPQDGHRILFQMLKTAARSGRGKLRWFPNTVIKELQWNANKTQILGVTSIQHQPAPGTAPLNTDPLSALFEDFYRYPNSPRLTKTIVQFQPRPVQTASSSAPSLAPSPVSSWYVIDASETGEVIALADLPYRQGIDPRSILNPSASSTTADSYCLQGYTYTFAMEQTRLPQPQTPPAFYARYAPYFSYELPRLANFDLVFTYRRIWSRKLGVPTTFRGVNFTSPRVGDISMQNWTWGNDYRPGTAADNLVYSRDQLLNQGQLAPGGWLGGLRVASLQAAEELALSYYYWLVAGITDSQLGPGVKQPQPNHRLLQGLKSPMGTLNGLAKFPYIRESRRIVGRSYWAYPEGFSIDEINISRKNFRDPFYQKALNDRDYFNLQVRRAGQQALDLIMGTKTLAQVKPQQRASRYPDTVGLGHYPIDFHPCLLLSPPETPNNRDRPGERQGASSTFAFQVPLRSLIPQAVENLLVVGKNITTSHIAAAAYRVHAYEWSAGAAAGIAVDVAIANQSPPADWLKNLPRSHPLLSQLQAKLIQTQNPIRFDNGNGLQ